MTLHELLHTKINLSAIPLNSRLWSGMLVVGLLLAFASSLLSALASLASLLMTVAICVILGGVIVLIAHMLAIEPEKPELRQTHHIYMKEQYVPVQQIEYTSNFYVLVQNRLQEPPQALPRYTVVDERDMLAQVQPSTFNRMIEKRASELAKVTHIRI